MFKRWQQAVDEGADINVVPVMNLFMVLIPFLLMGAAFYQIGVVPISTPTHNPEESDVPQTPTTVAVNLVLKADEMVLTASSTNLSAEELADLGERWPVVGGQYNLSALQSRLEYIKAKYPKSNTIVVVPHDDLAYQHLVEVLDVTRERPRTVDASGREIVEELFPVTVFTRFIPPPPEVESVEGEEGEEWEADDTAFADEEGAP